MKRREFLKALAAMVPIALLAAAPKSDTIIDVPEKTDNDVRWHSDLYPAWIDATHPPMFLDNREVALWTDAAHATRASSL